jgi:PAS domain S-box-containing protein
MIALLQRSLKTRVTLFTLSIFVICIWALAFYASRVLREDMERLLGEQQYSIVSLLAANINQELGDRLSALEKVVERLTPAMLGDAATMQRFLEDRPVLQTLFNGGIITYGTDGTVIADSLPAAGRIGANYLDIDTVAAALQEGRSTIGRLVMGKKLRAPVFSITVPVRDHQGKVIGALGGVVNLGTPGFLDKITESTHGTTGGYLIVAREYRLIITATDKSRIMETLPPAGVNWLVDRFIQGYEGSGVVVNPRGVEVLSSAKGVPAAGWYLAAYMPTAEAFAPIRAMQERMLLGTILFTLLAGSLTWWMLRRQLAPVVATAQTLAAQSAAGLPLQPLPITRQDEVGELFGGFNRLLLTLGQREEALKESEENLAVTLHSIGDAVIATDTVGRVTRMNPMAERLCGWMLADALGRPLSEVFRLFNADTREPGVNPVQSVLAHGQVVGLANHTVLLAKDGQEYRIADSAAPIRNAAGEIVGVVLVFSDITKKYRSEEALRDSEERFRNLYEQAPLAYQSLDAAGNILQVN